jgi:hypothetical protein
VKPATPRRPGRPREVQIKRTGRPRGFYIYPEFRVPLYHFGNPPGRPRKGERQVRTEDSDYVVQQASLSG